MQIITKQLTAEYYVNFYSVFPTNFKIIFLPHTCKYTVILLKERSDHIRTCVQLNLDKKIIS